MSDIVTEAPKHPLLSVVVAIVSDTVGSRCDASHLAGSLEALGNQRDAPPMEVIVPYHARVQGIEELRRRFPGVVFLPVDDLKTFTGEGGSREHHDELRARGVAAARGEIIGLLEDHARADPYWCARVVEAHRRGYAAVGGAIENGIDRPLNWAVYFCDFSRYQNPLPEGESPIVSDANVAYKRTALESIRPIWQDIFREVEVNSALRSRGEKLALSPKIVVHQHRGDLRLAGALKERFIWGRSYAMARGGAAGGATRKRYAALVPALPAVLLLRMIATVMKKRRRLGVFLKALPLTAILTVSWSYGELVGYLAAPRRGRGTPA
jgi:hypothetical protein